MREIDEHFLTIFIKLIGVAIELSELYLLSDPTLSFRTNHAEKHTHSNDITLFGIAFCATFLHTFVQKRWAFLHISGLDFVQKVRYLLGHMTPPIMPTMEDETWVPCYPSLHPLLPLSFSFLLRLGSVSCSPGWPGTPHKLNKVAQTQDSRATDNISVQVPLLG